MTVHWSNLVITERESQLHSHGTCGSYLEASVGNGNFQASTRNGVHHARFVREADSHGCHVESENIVFASGKRDFTKYFRKGQHLYHVYFFRWDLYGLPAARITL